ncbi:MAG: hypothetical protein ACPG7U_03995 [Holosporaceae bacterium]
MKHAQYILSLLLCSGVASLSAINGTQESTQEQSPPLAAAAMPAPSVPAASTPPMAQAAPRKICPEPFILDTAVLEKLQSDSPQCAQEREALFAQAAQAVALKMELISLPDETTVLLQPFVNVETLEMKSVSTRQLPQLPLPHKLTSLTLFYTGFKTIQNIEQYANLHTLRLRHLNAPDLAPLKTLRNLRTLECSYPLRFDGTNASHADLLVHLMSHNHRMTEFKYTGSMTADLLRQLPALHTLRLRACKIDDAGLALLPLETLDTLVLSGSHLVTLEALRDQPVRVLDLGSSQRLGTSFASVICSMPNIKVLRLNCCALHDAQVVPLLALAGRLEVLQLGFNDALSSHMHKQLHEKFGDKVYLKRYTRTF